jgi:predicted GTPase
VGYHPGEDNLRMADVVLVNKVDSAPPDAVARVVASVRSVNTTATLVQSESPVTLEGTQSLVDQRVLVIEDGPTITHGGMSIGAGTIAARQAGATELIDPRAFAVGSIAVTLQSYPHIGAVVPAMGYGAAQLRDLEATIRASGCDVVVNGSPARLGRLLEIGVPVRTASYELREIGHPEIADVLAPWIERWRSTS